MTTPRIDQFFSRAPICTDVQLVIYGGTDRHGRDLEPLEFEFASKGTDARNIAHAQHHMRMQRREHFILRDKAKTLTDATALERAA